jgi:DICT domain-containing protein
MNKFVTTQPEDSFSVGDLARAAGVATATVRSWEARFGFPMPTRQSGGHRRYDRHQVALVEEVVRLRRSGLSVPAAIDAARSALDVAPESFFASLRAGDRGLRTTVLGKRALGCVTRAFEDECLASAERPVLFAAFQRERFYRQSEDRWKELARTADETVVFADFAGGADASRHPVEAPLAGDSPVRREWALVCDAPRFSACLAGWELPSPAGTPDKDRRFETLWSLEPDVVRAATRVGIGLVRGFDPERARALEGRLPEIPGSISPDLRRATSLFARIMENVQSVA